jgi:hypothetical protein
MRNEIWKSIKGYEGFYEISNLGRVRSIKKSGKTRLKKDFGWKGYRSIKLHKNRKTRNFRVHRLVANAFLKIPFNKTENTIHHKNHIRHDNRPENLEWCSFSYNISKRRSSEELKKGLIKDILMCLSDMNLLKT